MGGLIYEWAYIRNGESVSKLVGLYMGELIFGGGLIFGGLRYCSNDSIKFGYLNVNNVELWTMLDSQP